MTNITYIYTTTDIENSGMKFTPEQKLFLTYALTWSLSYNNGTHDVETTDTGAILEMKRLPNYSNLSIGLFSNLPGDAQDVETRFSQINEALKGDRSYEVAKQVEDFCSFFSRAMEELARDIEQERGNIQIPRPHHVNSFG